MSNVYRVNTFIHCHMAFAGFEETIFPRSFEDKHCATKAENP